MKIFQADPEVLRNNRELTEQAGMWAVSVDLFIDVLNILKVRGARLLKEMVKSEENDTEAVLSDPDWL